MKLQSLLPVGVGGERGGRPKRKTFLGGAYILLVYGWLSGERTVAKSSHIVGGRRRRGEGGKVNKVRREKKLIKQTITNSKYYLLYDNLRALISLYLHVKFHSP